MRHIGLSFLRGKPHRTAKLLVSISLSTLAISGVPLLANSPAFAQAPSTNTVTATVPVGYYPAAVAYDLANNDIYVANFSSGNVSVISGSTNTVTATVFVGSGPDGVANDSANNDIYVANAQSGTVSVITTVLDTDLAITAPANQTVNATSPSGATVNYSVPTTDPDEGTAPQATCSVPSGSVFPVGTTTVKCSVTDSEDTPSTVSTSFTVTVLDTDLAITAPANQTVNATSPSGATVNYSVPTADPDEGTAPQATCSVPSGSVFPVGTTTVKCSVTDSEDTPSTVSTSFTVTVLGAKSQLKQLGSSLTGVGPGTSLLNKINTALSDLNSGNPNGAKAVLQGFINEVRAQSGKKISKALADTLIADAQRIINVIG